MIIDDNTYVRLFSNCKLVNGIKRSIICDLQKGDFEFVPNSLLKVVSDFEKRPLNIILNESSSKEKQIVYEYVEFLIEKEFAFFCEEDELRFFPELSSKWDFPGEISNAIIDLDDNSIYDLQKTFLELENLGCQYVLIKSYSLQTINYFEDKIKYLEGSRISSVEIVTPFINDLGREELKKFIASNARVRTITFWGTGKNEEEVLSNCIVYFSTKKITNSLCCGEITPKNFRVNIDAFFESKSYNSCLNRKISISTNGEIKNCPAMDLTFGNIDQNFLKEAVNDVKFRKFWGIRKSQIESCKKCEFRHICSDCRAFLSPKDIYNKPKKCNYDPYTATWL